MRGRILYRSTAALKVQYPLCSCTAVRVICYLFEWKHLKEASWAAVQLFSWEEEYILHGADRSLMQSEGRFRCLWGLSHSGVGRTAVDTHSVEGCWCNVCLFVRRVATLRLERSCIPCWISLTQGIKLSICKQSLNQVDMQQVVGMCMFSVRKQVGGFCRLSDLGQQGGCRGDTLET